MSDAPMSRRERRTFEEEAAERAALQDPTPAFGQGIASGEIAAIDADGEALSRRDRRRLERLAHPLEAWTAEEEMLATGQIPMMTPERIAEQEQISREKAATAAQEATAASQEFRRLASSEIRQSPAPLAQPFFDEPVAHEPPPLDHAPQEPAWHEPQAQAPGVEQGREMGNSGPSGEIPMPANYEPLMALDDVPLVAVHHVDSHAPVNVVPEVLGAHHEYRTAVTDALFPPGSAQAMLRQLDPFAGEASDSQVSAEAEHIPTLDPPQEVPARAVSAVDEMRRLAADAMSSIERASKADEAAAAAEASAEAAAAAAVEAAAAPRSPEPSAISDFNSLPSMQAQPGAQQAGAARTPQGPGAGGAMADFAWGATEGDGTSGRSVGADPRFDSDGFQAYGEKLAPATSVVEPEQHHAEFEQFMRPTSDGASPGQAPAYEGMSGRGEFPVEGQQGPQGLQAPQGPAWASHPTDGGQGPADPNNFTPLVNVPKPDFSAFYQQGSSSGFAPVTGAINISSFAPGGFNASGLNAPGFNTSDPSMTGQVPAIRRPDLPEVGGAKHFKWVHLAVIGALMFVLGVVIYNAAFAQ